MTAKVFAVSVVAIVLFQLVLMILFAVNNSPTVDEPIHLMGGVNYLKNRDFILNPESGVFPQVLAALPNLDVKIPPSNEMAAIPPVSMLRRVLYPALCEAGINTVFLKGRLMIGLLNIMTGLLILFTAKRFFGRVPALCSFALYAFFPLFLSNGTLTTADMAATFAFFISCAAYGALLRRITIPRLLAAAGASLLLCISKFSAVLLGPAVLVMILYMLVFRTRLEVALPFQTAKYRSAGRKLAAYALSLTVIGLIVWGAIWAVYFFRFDMYHDEANPVRKEALQYYVGDSFVQKAGEFAAEHKLLPEGFVYGFLYTYYHSMERWSFLNGKVSMTGFRSYFPQAFLMKTPPPIILAIVIGVILCAYSMRTRLGRCRMACIMPFLVFAGIYLVTALNSHLNIGFRHLMPAFPGLFLICAGGFRQLHLNSKRLVRIIPPLLAVYCALEAARTGSAQLSYFSPFYGGSREGFRHLVDSSLDWGQDFDRIRSGLEKNGVATDGSDKVFIAYFGSNLLDMPRRFPYRIVTVSMCGQMDKNFYELTDGVYCISATVLQGIDIPVGVPLPPSRETVEKFKRSFYILLDRQTKMGDAMWDGLSEQERNKLLKDAYHFQLLRFEALRRVLVRVEPDFFIGDSILAYRLSDSDMKSVIGEEYRR